MPSSIAYNLWIACTLLEIFACALIIVRGQFRQHLALWSYLALCVSISALRFQVLAVYGFSSREYLYLYYYSDAILTTALYLAVLEPYRKLFPGPPTRIAFRLAQVGGPILVAFFSATILLSGGPSIFGRFFVEFSQNLLLLGSLMALLLFHPRLWDRRVPVHVYQLIFVLGALFVFLLSTYALGRLSFPVRQMPQGLQAFRELLLPIGVACVFSNSATSRNRPQIWL